MSGATGASFSLAQRSIYLAEMRLHGKKGLAAESAGTSLSIVEGFKRNFDEDGEFKAAERLAIELRSETIAYKLEREFLEGILEPILGPDGKQVMVKMIDPNSPTGFVEMPGWKRKIESGARLRMLERHDPSYREHKEIDINSTTGALVTPPSQSLDDFAKLAAEITARQQQRA